MKEEKLYICGKITGVENLNVEKFDKYEEKFKKEGYFVVNPHHIKSNWKSDKEWSFYMRNDIINMVDCDIIVVLDDWADSKGARLEILIAQQLDKKIIDAETGKEFEWLLKIDADFSRLPRTRDFGQASKQEEVIQ